MIRWKTNLVLLLIQNVSFSPLILKIWYSIPLFIKKHQRYSNHFAIQYAKWSKYPKIRSLCKPLPPKWAKLHYFPISLVIESQPHHHHTTLPHRHHHLSLVVPTVISTNLNPNRKSFRTFYLNFSPNIFLYCNNGRKPYKNHFIIIVGLRMKI